MLIDDLGTPSLLVEQRQLAENLAIMSRALPGRRLRPHVKAHKCTALAARQRAVGHIAFTCATIREVEGMAAAGLGDDLLLANEVLDTGRLGAVVERGARITVAVDSQTTIDAARAGGVAEVVIDVNVGMDRCGCPPHAAGYLADTARAKGLRVRGVMGYEGHLMTLQPATERAIRTGQAMRTLLRAHASVGGELITAGGTGTYAINSWATEIQAGSYALMDTTYAGLGLPFTPALTILCTVISTSGDRAVLDAGLKAFSTDHGTPTVSGAKVLSCSDEHTVVATSHDHQFKVGDRIRILPAHIDPTAALHPAMHLVDGDQVIGHWPIDLRGW